MTTGRRSLGYSTAAALVVASMIGTGVFTSLGLQVALVDSGFALLALWLIGGIVALCGALCYGELAAILPRSGGEYTYLSAIYHPLLGVVSGFISLTVGFAAPVALAAMAFGHYASRALPVRPMAAGLVVLLFVTAVHSSRLRFSRRFQVSITVAILILIVGFGIAGLFADAAGDARFSISSGSLSQLVGPGFAVSLIYVFYAYSGWNAAVYIAGEIARPQRTVPRALLHGTLIVTGLYLLLNFVFLRTVPLADLEGTVEIGALSARQVFGATGAAIVNGLFCVIFLSTMSAMVMAGPRVIQTIGEDLPLLRVFSRQTAGGVPARAILLQQALAFAFVLTDSFEAVLTYAGFTLNVSVLLGVAGVVVLRWTAPRLPRPYRAWGYPLTPAVFIGVSLWVLVFVLKERPLAAGAAVLTILVGVIVAIVQRGRRAPQHETEARSRPRSRGGG